MPEVEEAGRPVTIEISAGGALEPDMAMLPLRLVTPCHARPSIARDLFPREHLQAPCSASLKAETAIMCGGTMEKARKDYAEAQKALREAQEYADAIEPKRGQPPDAKWVMAQQLVGMLEATVNRLAQKIADLDD
jgi:hypothetical protein